MKYSDYVLYTILYGVIGLVGLVLSIVFLIQERYILVGIGFLIFLISMDNFFCNSRAKKCGIKTTGHYSLPEFLKRK